MAAKTSARFARIGADPRDDEDLRHKKALVVLLAVLILPVSLVWGASYLAFGARVGVLPFIYFAISVGSLVVFSRTRSFAPFLTAQLLDVLLMTTIGQMLSGGFLPSGGVGLWGMLAPLGALVFLEVRQAIGWFVGFLAAFVLLGIVGEVFFNNVDVPTWLTTTMLALNVIGTGAVAFTVLASFATQRNAALAALRAEQERSEALIKNVLPSSIAERLRAATGSIADHVESASILFADVDLTPLAQRLSPAEVVGTLDRCSPTSTRSSSGTGSRRSRRSATATWLRRVCPFRAPITRAGQRPWRSTCRPRLRPRRSPAETRSS